jgi:hypothetical protein
MDTDRGKVTLRQEPVEFVCTRNFGDEDDNLVKLENIQEIVEFTVLLRLGKLDVIQLKTVKSKFGVVIHVYLHGILTKLATHRANVLVERGTKHHNLLLMRRHAEDFLDISTHVQSLQHFVALIHHKVLHMIQLESFFASKTQDATRSSNDDVRTGVCKQKLKCAKMRKGKSN